MGEHAVSFGFVHLPLLRWLRDLFQSAAGLLKLCQGVWWGQGGHGRVLDERVRGLDLGGRRAGDGGGHRGGVVAQLSRHPRVHGAGALHRRRARRLAAGPRPPRATGAAAEREEREEARGINN